MPRHKQPKGMFDQQRWELPKGSRVWVYLRHSPGDNQTIDSQIMGVRQWSDEEEWTIERTFIDEAQQGSKDQREQFQEMIALSRQQPRLVDGIVIWSFSRFARNQNDSQFYKADLRKRGFVVVSKIDDIPNNEIAPIIEAVVDWKNQRFLEDLSADVKRGHVYLAERGFVPMGQPPVGYRYERVEMGRRRNGEMRYGNRLVKDETMSERVALAWKMKLEANAGYLQIQRATGLYTHFASFEKFFSNLVYAGIFYFHGKRYPSNWEDGGRFCEPYVSVDDFEKVQQNRALRTIKHISPRSLSSPFLLTGVLRCGLCAAQGRDAKVTGQVNGISSPYLYYRCSTRIHLDNKYCELPRIPTQRLDKMVMSYLKRQVLTSEYVQAEVGRLNASLASSRQEVQLHILSQEQVVQDCQRRVESIVDLIGRKGVTPILERQYDEANQAWLSASTQLNESRSSLYTINYETVSLSQAQQYLDRMQFALDNGVIQEQRALIAHFIDRIYLYPEHAEMVMRYRADGLITTFDRVTDTNLASVSPLYGRRSASRDAAAAAKHGLDTGAVGGI